MTEFARMFKKNENPNPVSMTTGIVISPPPEVEISLNDVIILRKHQLIFAAHMLIDYKRELELEGEIKFTDEDCGTITNAAGHGTVVTLNVDTNYEAKKVKITMKDTIVKGDEVILMPTADNQLYFVLDKAVRFP